MGSPWLEASGATTMESSTEIIAKWLAEFGLESPPGSSDEEEPGPPGK